MAALATRIDLDRLDLTTHVLRDAFGAPERWGIPSPITSDWRVAAGSLSQLVIGADGKISPAEREASMMYGKLLGLTPEEERQLRAVDPSKADLATYAKPELRPLMGPLLYVNIGIARADGFHEMERAACRKLCRALGVDPAILVSIETLLELDDVTLQNRIRLIAPPSDLANAGAGPMIAEGGFARAMQYGFGPGPMPRDFARRLGEGALLIAAADGDVSEAEMRWFLGHMHMLGAPRDLLAEFLRFRPGVAELGQVVDARMKPFAKAALYLGLRVARADGVSPRERHLAEQAAKLLGLDAAFVVALENQLRTEDALREGRIRVLSQLL